MMTMIYFGLYDGYDWYLTGSLTDPLGSLVAVKPAFLDNRPVEEKEWMCRALGSSFLLNKDITKWKKRCPQMTEKYKEHIKNLKPNDIKFWQQVRDDLSD